MGLLDTVLGSVLGGQPSADGGQNNGLAGLVGPLLDNPHLLQALAGVLANDGPAGGIGGLIASFLRAGLGEVTASWIGAGQNQAISGEQIGQALGPETIADLAGKLGSSSSDTAQQLSQVLPDLIDQLTPAGQRPQNGLGNGGDLMRMLGRLLAGR
ncbi:MAG TPA: YidB family protein [Accumulibacter sp.]|uniref:YidB family protein n=1 Tax=Accumulibacter sp. TaxID=2053492 RepID=UPI002C6ED153|nr:YidB family protein [Accumulibacter sp.]HRF71889.1 YidB family protein [Accumulibacter sp.]